jgi:hypothetical protein
MRNLTSTFSASLTSPRRPGTATTVLLLPLALIYAVSGVLNALHASGAPATGILRDVITVLLPSITAIAALWITNASSLSCSARRVSLGAVLIGSGLVAMVATFGP